MKKFINYAHRGASEYYPENTILSFDKGLEMEANGIETDVQKTKDGVLVLFHDDTLDRVTGKSGCVADYTYQELMAFDVKKGDITAKITTLEAFLQRYADKDLTFAIELKEAGIEKETADLIYKYNAQDKVIITSFKYDAIAQSNIIKTLVQAFELNSRSSNPLETADLAKEAEEYIAALGLTADEIASLKANLSKAEEVEKEEPTTPNVPVVDNKDEKPGKTPETGDTTPTYYLGVAVVALMCAVVTLKVRKRNSF